MSTPLRALIVEDNEDDALLLLHELRHGGYDATFERVETAEAMRTALARQKWDIIISDFRLPRFNGLEALELFKQSSLDIPFILVSGTIGEETAVAAMKAGAHDYLMKGNLKRLVPAVARELHEAQVRQERKRAEEALQAQRNFALQVLNAMGQGLTVTDADGRFEYVNPTYARMVGHAPKDLVGKRPQDVTAPEDHAVLSREYTRRQAGESSTYETRLKHINGQHVPVLITAVPRWREGKADGAIAVITDLTERKRAEEALRESEERYRGLFEHMVEGYAYCQMVFENSLARDWIYLAVNDAFETLTGLKDVTGKRVTEVIPGIREADPELFNIYTRVSLTGKPEKFEMFVEALKMWFSISVYSPEKGFFVAVFDVITDRKRAEQVVRESEERLRALVESASDAIVSADSQGNIISWNKGAEKMFGYREEEILGKSPTVLMPERYIQGYRMETQRVYATGELPSILGKTIETHGIRKDGSEFPLELSLGMWQTHEGRFSTVILRDITDRKLAEEQVRQNAARAESLARTAARLNAQLDLNAVLNAVCEETVRALNIPAASVILLDTARGELNLMASVGLPDDYVQRHKPIAKTRYAELARDAGAVVVVPDAQQLADMPNAELYARYNVRTIAGAKMEREGTLFGTLNVYALGETHTFTDDELALLQGIADQAAQAITNARLFEETNRRVQHLRALRDVDQAITASLDLRVTLGILLDQVVVQLHVDAADILLFNPSLHTLDYVAGRGFHSRGIERSALRLGQGHAGRIVLERRSLTIHNLAETNEFVRAPLVAGEGFVSYIGVPLIAKGEVKGVLEIFQRSQLDPDPEWLNFLQTLAGQAAIALDNMQLFDGLQRSNVDLRIAYDATIEGWSRALDLRDKETEGHTQRVTEMMEQLARSMGISEVDLVHVRRGALLHDIGKMGVPDSILLKPDKLTDEEWVSMRRHPTYAYEMLAPIAYLRPALDIPYCHHEKWDGTGYPRGLQGEQIPLVARMFAVVDVWDALRSDRLYRPAWSEEKVREHIRAGAGTHFDPKVVEAFLQMVKEEDG